MSPQQPQQRQEDVGFLLKMVAVKPVGATGGNVSENVRQLVIQGLPHALADQKAERHEYQEEFARLTRNVLEDLERVAVEQVAAAEANVTEAQGECDAAVEAEKDAAATLEASHADVKCKADSHVKAVAVAKEAENEQKESEQTNEVVAERMRSIRTESEKACSVFEGPFRMLREGGWADEEMLEECMEPISEHLTARGKVEAPLLAAASLALNIQPCDRGPFDKLVVDELVELFQKDAADAAECLAESAPREAQASAEALGFWALADVLRDRSAESGRALAESERAAKESNAAHEDGKRKASECQSLLGSRITKKTSRTSHHHDVTLSLAAYERLIVDDYALPEIQEVDVEVMNAEAETVEVKNAEAETVLETIPATKVNMMEAEPSICDSPALGA